MSVMSAAIISLIALLIVVVGVLLALAIPTTVAVAAFYAVFATIRGFVRSARKDIHAVRETVNELRDAEVTPA